MQKFALIRPDLRFIFMHNDHEIYTLTAESLPERIVISLPGVQSESAAR
jgi:hypothetical protein